MPNDNTVLNYESANANAPCLCRFVKPIAVALSIAIALGLTSITVSAWITHFEWQRSGAYAQNSFPMGWFAEKMTWISVSLPTCCHLRFSGAQHGGGVSRPAAR